MKCETPDFFTVSLSKPVSLPIRNSEELKSKFEVTYIRSQRRRTSDPLVRYPIVFRPFLHNTLVSAQPATRALDIAVVRSMLCLLFLDRNERYQKKSAAANYSSAKELPVRMPIHRGVGHEALLPYACDVDLHL